jgi:biopolymer transport protein ExbB/TolQ
LITRYFTNHPVEYIETVMFSIGLAALVLKALDIFGQYSALRRSPLEAVPRTAQPVDQCHLLLDALGRLHGRRQDDYYIRRLRGAIEHVGTCGSAESLGDELRYLADVDAARLHASYGLFRVILWAIPILGFLGTVMGITMALNGVDLKAPDQSMIQVLTGLGLKFDTTALALTLSMLLMFVHFFVDRAENALLVEVDRLAEQELIGRFPQVPAGPDGQLIAVRRMAETMVQAAERLVQRQAELWQASLESAAARWTQMADTAGEQVRRGLSGALAESLKAHAQQLAAAEAAAAEQSRRHWDKVQQSQVQSVQMMTSLQAALGHQAEVLQRAVEASGEVRRLEDALNRNLATLSGAKHFAQTVMSLAAAIHLLNARLAETPVAPVKLESTRRKAQAA